MFLKVFPLFNFYAHRSLLLPAFLKSDLSHSLRSLMTKEPQTDEQIPNPGSESEKFTRKTDSVQNPVVLFAFLSIVHRLWYLSSDAKWWMYVWLATKEFWGFWVIGHFFIKTFQTGECTVLNCEVCTVQCTVEYRVIYTTLYTVQYNQCQKKFDVWPLIRMAHVR